MSDIDKTDPFVAFIAAHPRETVILRNDEASRKDKVQQAIFYDWIAYLEDTGRHAKARYWKWLRAGNSHYITLPCADPAKFDAKWAPRRTSHYNREQEIA